MTRIVSLLPSATEIVHALGMGEYQIGRSHSCDFPLSVQSLPVCTEPKFAITGNSREIDIRVKETLRNAVSVYRVFEDVVEELQPTHIVTQSQCDVCAVSLKEVEVAVAEYISSSPTLLSLEAQSLGEVWNDIRLVAEGLNRSDVGSDLIGTLTERIDRISERALAVGSKPSVVCLEWLEPLIGAGNWVPDLVELAGGQDLLGDPGRHSGYIKWADIMEKDPDIIVLMPCGFDMKKTVEESYWLTERPEWASLKAVRDRRVYVTDGDQYFNRPGPRLVESLQILAEIFHPGLFTAVFEGSAWRRMR
jgi:iron complex transport system substrate-binding protein